MNANHFLVVQHLRELTYWIQLQQSAQQQEKGLWKKDNNVSLSLCTKSCDPVTCHNFDFVVLKAVRNVSWNIENLNKFVEKNRGKQLDGK